MKLIIEDDEGRRTVVPLFGDVLAIGRGEGNLVRLTEKDVSRRHAKLVRRGARFYLEDLSTFRSVRVNGDPVHGARQVGEGDLIEISRYDLMLQGAPGEKRDSDARGEGVITAKIGRLRGRRGRAALIATFVVALLLASALAAALWLRAARGAVTDWTSGAIAATAAGVIAEADYDKRASGGSVPPESR